MYRVPGNPFGQFVGCEPSSRVDGTHVLTHMCIGEREVRLPFHLFWVAGAFIWRAEAVRDAAGDEAPVFRVARINGVGRLLEGRALDRALDPAAVVGGRCDEQPC